MDATETTAEAGAAYAAPGQGNGLQENISAEATTEWRRNPYSHTDDGNALRLVDDHHHRFRRVADMRKWFFWDGRRWAIDHEDRAIREAARQLARELPNGDSEQKAFRRNAMSATGIASCTRVAQSDRRISTLAADLDSHPTLINTQSGLLDLRCTELRPHDPKLLITRITAHRVELHAPHPRWDRFLAETFEGDTGLINYMQRVSGLALLGVVVDHVLPFLHGVGRNGKTVFVNVLQGLLGEADLGGYALSAPDGFLMAGRENKHETEIARLRGARLVIASEQSSGNRFDEVKIKRLTGGDILTGRMMRQDFFDFHPSHLIMVLSNHLPAVKEGGPAFWRRVRLIPFKHVVPEDQQIPDLADQLLAAEGPAILGWAARGAAQVLASGLGDPDLVLAATEAYRISEDSLASFVQDQCVLGADYWCKIADLRARYEHHCRDMACEPISAKAITMRLANEYAVISTKHSQLKIRIYRGIGLQDDGRDEAGDR
jgi:putative DNA primase/helicase